jgi:peptide/nickel transport system ATP-binding protein
VNANTPTLVVTDRLVKHFKSDGGMLRRRAVIRAVNGVSLSIRRGEALALVGESGSGKTTFGRCLMRLMEPTSGSIQFDGVDFLSLRGNDLRRFRRRLQIVFQDPAGSLNPRMTVGAAVREPIEVHRLARGAAAKADVRRLFEEVGLDAGLYDRYPHELSGGQKQRVGIARALAVQPEFLVLDEPVSALDVSVQAQVLTLLDRLRTTRALTYLFIAHDLAVVRHIADRVAVMYLGRIVELAPNESIYSDPRHPYTTALLSAAPVPDPDAASRRIVLEGELPSPRQIPRGCPFVSRCPHPRKSTICEEEPPALTAVDGHHVAACHFVNEPMPLGGVTQPQTAPQQQ